jgi:hypothetical protein
MSKCEYPDADYYPPIDPTFVDSGYHSLDASADQLFSMDTPSPSQSQAPPPRSQATASRSQATASRSQAPPKRRCPVNSCVKNHQKKGYFIKHFVKEHEKYSRFYTVQADTNSRPLFALGRSWSCDVCERARFDKASTLADHIWTHMPELPTEIAQSHFNSSFVPSSICEPLSVSTSSAFASSLLATSNSGQIHSPIVTVDNFQSGQNSPPQQPLEIGSTQEMTKTISVQKQSVEIKSSSPSSSPSEDEGNQIQPCANEKGCASVPEGIMQWVDATKDVTSVLSQPPSI